MYNTPIMVETAGYIAELDTDGKVRICQTKTQGGIWVGDGRLVPWSWRGIPGYQIVACAATLPEGVYEALEEALGEALREAEE
jgi:hypothetical protein